MPYKVLTKINKEGGGSNRVKNLAKEMTRTQPEIIRRRVISLKKK